jgi:hypothetical protein
MVLARRVGQPLLRMGHARVRRPVRGLGQSAAAVLADQAAIDNAINSGQDPTAAENQLAADQALYVAAQPTTAQTAAAASSTTYMLYGVAGVAVIGLLIYLATE